MRKALTRRRSLGIGLLVSLLIHVGLIAALLGNVTAYRDSGEQAPAMAVRLLVIPLPQVAPPKPAPAPAKNIIARSRARDLAALPMRAVTPAEPELTQPARDEPNEEARVTAPGASVRERLVEHAKRDVAGILREFDKEQATQDKGLTSERQQRIDLRFAEAHAAAVPGWRRAARIEEIPGSAGGSRVYRITTPLGTYCVTYSSGGGRPTYGSCPD